MLRPVARPADPDESALRIATVQIDEERFGLSRFLMMLHLVLDSEDTRFPNGERPGT